MTPDITTNKTTVTTMTAAAAATVTTSTISKAIIYNAMTTSTTPPLPTTSSSSSTTTLTSTIAKTPLATTSSIMQRNILTIEKLRNRVHQILKCVINLHIDILVIESNVNQLLDDVKEFNNELMEVKRLDNLIETLRDYSGPTIYHEWPFPLVYQGTIDEADLAQSLNSNEILKKS